MPAPRTSSLPVALHVAGRRCVVVGGGHVGIRRAVQLADRGAEVVLVAPELWPASALDTLRDRGVVWERRAYATGDLSGAFLAVAATGHDDVDAAVLDEAVGGGVLVNHVSDADAGDLSFQAARTVDGVQVSVSTDGRTPALTRWMRDRLAEEVADGYPALVRLFAETRDELRAAGRPTRIPGWEAALEAGLLETVRAGDIDGARRCLRAHVGLDS